MPYGFARLTTAPNFHGHHKLQLPRGKRDPRRNRKSGPDCISWKFKRNNQKILEAAYPALGPLSYPAGLMRIRQCWGVQRTPDSGRSLFYRIMLKLIAASPQSVLVPVERCHTLY
jgi:hypothetical protein